MTTKQVLANSGKQAINTLPAGGMPVSHKHAL
jgi:hypothetical protein